MENSTVKSYLLFLDGVKHSIWNNKQDALHQVDTLSSYYGKKCVTIEELPDVQCNNGVYFL